jgi:glutamyl-Q tRNA(Asp) synthetase
MAAYIGRFAPSPTGALHAGSLVAALASWLDARAHGGKWLVRIEDVDTPRCVKGADQEILRQLAACGLHPDEPPMWQSQRDAAYQAALDQLIAQKAAYPCSCSRRDIEAAWATRGVTKERHAELIYPGTCRKAAHGPRSCAWRLQTGAALFLSQNRPLPGIESLPSAMNLEVSAYNPITWQDRRLGAQQQEVEQDVGDFVLRRADGLWAYQLAVVVDDAAQGITHIVRGEDLADNTARQILLQRTFGYPMPNYLHTPLVLSSDGHKLSKQNGATALILRNSEEVVTTLAQAAVVLGLKPASSGQPGHDGLAYYVTQWQQTHLDSSLR